MPRPQPAGPVSVASSPGPASEPRSCTPSSTITPGWPMPRSAPTRRPSPRPQFCAEPWPGSPTKASPCSECSDNGAAYRSFAWREVCAELDITPKWTRPYRPQTNGKIERFHRTLADGWAYARLYESSDQPPRRSAPLAPHLQSPPRPHRNRRIRAHQPLNQPLRSVHLVGEGWAGGIPAQYGVAPRVRIGKTKWFNLLWLIPIGFLLLVIGIAVAKGIRELPAVQDFIARHPGESDLPEGAPVGLPAWLGWQHFLNLFLMIFIIRSGITIIADHPRFYWTRHSTPGKEWFRIQNPVPPDPLYTAKQDSITVPDGVGLPGRRHSIGLARWWRPPNSGSLPTAAATEQTRSPSVRCQGWQLHTRCRLVASFLVLCSPTNRARMPPRRGEETRSASRRLGARARSPPRSPLPIGPGQRTGLPVRRLPTGVRVRVSPQQHPLRTSAV